MDHHTTLISPYWPLSYLTFPLCLLSFTVTLLHLHLFSFSLSLSPASFGDARILQTLCTSSPALTSCLHRHPRASSPPSVPSPLVIAYASWGQCDGKILSAAENGANVIIWFSILLESSERTGGIPTITGSLPDVHCVANLARQIRQSSSVTHDVLHLVSIGGWNAPLPNTTHTVEEWAAAFARWNSIDYTRADMEWYGFDGIDWDAEGNDDPNEIKNHVTISHLRLIGGLSQRLKQMGYIISLAPAQSYLDVNSNQFDMSLTHTPVWKNDFPYHGANLYAYLLAFHSKTEETTADNTKKESDTFDWVAIQLYEGWSRTNDAVATRNIPFQDYIEALVNAMDKGWNVDFGNDLGGQRMVTVKRHSLVIGLANAWTDPYPPTHKFLLVKPHELELAWKRTSFAGFMFWTIAEEGRQLDGNPLFLTKELANIVHGSNT